MNLYFKPVARAVGCAILGMALSGPSQASNFQFARYLEFGATATDNPELELDPGDSELVWSVKPSVELKFSGNRIGVIAVGELEYFKFTNADGDVADPRFFARTRGTIIDNLLYIDATLISSKVAPDSNFLRLSQDGDPGLSLKSKLYIDRSFGQFADLYAAYNHNSFFNTLGSEASSVGNGVEVFLGRSPKYGGVFWGLGGSYEENESTSNLIENSTAYGLIGVALSKTVLTQLTVGTENQKFIDEIDTVNPVTTEDESTLWDASLTWSSSERTKLTVGYGEQTFSAGPTFQLRHRTENSNILVGYTRDISRSNATLDSTAALSNTTGTSLASDTGSVNVNNANLGGELDEPFVNNRLQVAYKLRGRRSDLIFDMVYSVQDPLVGEDDIESFLGRLIFDRKLSDLTLLRLQYDYRKSDAPNRQNLTYGENRVGIKFIFNFDRVGPTEEISG